MDTQKKITTAIDSDISAEEKRILDESTDYDLSGDDRILKKAELDNTDEEGEPLNEKNSADDISGNDLDIPGTEDDDEDEMIGEEDEENNGYSEADTE